MSIVVKAPSHPPLDLRQQVFLAGSIENGAAENWQDRAARMFYDRNYILLNPRRDDWDASWEQSRDNPQFLEQVLWELKYINGADYVLFYFDPNTKSPVTLIEFGMLAAARPDRIVVVCPDGFWRKGNVDVVCLTQGVKSASTLEEAVAMIQRGLA